MSPLSERKSSLSIRQNLVGEKTFGWTNSFCRSLKTFYDERWGRFLPEQRLNVDQVPLPFVIDKKTTYEVPCGRGKERRDHRVWVAQPGSGLDKRQATLQLCFGLKTVMKPALIFRGMGVRISKAEVLAYDKDVDIFWQAKAWADTRVSVEWVKKSLSPVVSSLPEYILFCDNLTTQVSDQFRKAVSDTSGNPHYGIPNGTHFWQPVDAAPGKTFVSLIKQAQNEWFEYDDNVELWLGNDTDKKLTASDRRILLCQWVGQAYRQFKSSQYDQMRYRAFEKKGCLITANGDFDEKNQPEGMPN